MIPSENIILSQLGRTAPLFRDDIAKNENILSELVGQSSFLVIGAAGSIGQPVVREIFKRNPKRLHAIDINENNMVELVRDIRSTFGYIDGDFRTFAIDCGSRGYDIFLANEGPYDYVLNLSALKHVRNEKDPFTLMRMVEVNILNAVKIIHQARAHGVKKYFCVSTDKAANPVNMMGGSKRIMEMFLMRESKTLPVSTARFANVAFSDGSLLYGFNRRFAKRQPISAPYDIYRYFITPQESGALCLMSCLLGDNRDIFFPKPDKELKPMDFSAIAVSYLKNLGYEAYECASEDEARRDAEKLIKQKKWPCYFFKSDTTGEKGCEEFFMQDEELDMSRFTDIGIVKSNLTYDDARLENFLQEIADIRAGSNWSRQAIINLFNKTIENFNHKETGKYLDQRM